MSKRPCRTCGDQHEPSDICKAVVVRTISDYLAAPSLFDVEKVCARLVGALRKVAGVSPVQAAQPVASDLISRLADDILAMIHAQPRSPTKEEIEGVLQPLSDALRMLKDAEALSSYPVFGIDKASGPDRTVVWAWDDCQGEPLYVQWSEPNDPPN